VDWIVIGVMLVVVVVWAVVRYNGRTAGSDGTHHAGTRKPIDWLGD
jgi:hypothetical protein